jgi:hypothetical protein
MKNWLQFVFAQAFAIDNAQVKFASLFENSSSNSFP